MEGLVKEYANFLNDDKKPASEKLHIMIYQTLVMNYRMK